MIKVFQQKEYLIQYGMKIDDLFYAPCAVDNAFFQQLSKSYSKDIVRKKIFLKFYC